MPRTIARVKSARQAKATTAAKSARLEEAGLGGRRTGKASARTRVAQAKRDARRAAPAPTPTHEEHDTPAQASAPAARKPASPTKPASKLRKKRDTPMIEVSTSNSVPGSASLATRVRQVVRRVLSRFAPRLTRIDVYMSDENAAKGGANDKRCQIEARPASQRPLSASASAPTVEVALNGAVNKMKRKLATRFDRPPRT